MSAKKISDKRAPEKKPAPRREAERPPLPDPRRIWERPARAEQPVFEPQAFSSPGPAPEPKPEPRPETCKPDLVAEIIIWAPESGFENFSDFIEWCARERRAWFDALVMDSRNLGVVARFFDSFCASQLCRNQRRRSGPPLEMGASYGLR